MAVLMAISSTALVLASAQGSPLAKKTATIPFPDNGNATVAHLVVDAKPKKGKKPKKPVKRPKLKVLKAPKGTVVAASFKRDAKVKNRWHATVVATNPVEAPLRVTSASDATSQEQAILVTIVETDDAYIVLIEEVEIVEDATYQQMPVPPWMLMYCDPPGSAGDAYLLGPAPAGVPATEFLDYGCLLGGDGPTTGEDFDELGLAGLVVDLDPFPGNPNEYYVNFELVNIEGANAAAFQFPSHNVTAQLPPPGTAGVISTSTVTWGNRNTPFVEGQEYRGNVRLNSPLMPNERPRGAFTETYAPPYSPWYPVIGIAP